MHRWYYGRVIFEKDQLIKPHGRVRGTDASKAASSPKRYPGKKERRLAPLRHTYLWGYRAINTMEEPNGQEWEIEQEGTPEQKDKEIDESRREEAA